MLHLPPLSSNPKMADKIEMVSVDVEKIERESVHVDQPAVGAGSRVLSTSKLWVPFAFVLLMAAVGTAGYSYGRAR